MTEIPNIVPEFSRPFLLDRLSTAGNRLRLEATKEECAALCERFFLLSIDSLVAEVELKPLNGPLLVRLKGRIIADIVQQCVVTLEPVPEHIDELFSLTYAAEQGNDHKRAKEIIVEYDDEDDFLEPIIGGTIDLGEAVAEHLALALDPFPRSQHVSSESEEGAENAEDEGESKSPLFQSLVGLTKKKS